jgi:LmbE family N-acetylglucosaminyl deacetylase
MPGLLAFHAHPDDEVTSTGGVLARYADAGEQVVVVTATDGAEGEIHNYENPDELKPSLADMRAEEIEKALAILGVHHHAFLGYRDSGMMGTDANGHDDSFWQADLFEATGRLIHQIRKYQPEVMIVYDPFGGYGHPDHIQVHRVGMAAFHGAPDLGRFPLEDGEEMWVPSKLYWAAWPRSRVQRFAQRRLDRGDIDEEQYERLMVSGTPDDLLTAIIDIEPWIERKFDAWRAHRTQIPDDWWMFQVPIEDRPEVFGRETFQRIITRVETPYCEHDLFTGLR